MPALVAGIHAFGPCGKKDVDGRAKGERSAAVVRTAMPGHYETHEIPHAASFRILARRADGAARVCARNRRRLPGGLPVAGPAGGAPDAAFRSLAVPGGAG